MVFRQIID